MNYQWAIIGAGPAGIAVVGKLLDHGILPEEIVWIDPHFSAGDFGLHWSSIPSNTQVKLFLKFLNDAHSFDFANRPKKFALEEMPHDQTCALSLMVEPLQWITSHLQEKIKTVKGIVQHLQMKNQAWSLLGKEWGLTAKNVVLCIGAEPLTLAHPGITSISLHDALNFTRLQACCSERDRVALFGSSHSAILVLQNLLHLPVDVINFYRSPLRYAIHLKDQILFDNTGLKATTAKWAREHLQSELPPNLLRLYSNDANIAAYLPQCNKVIYAIGFEKRRLKIEGIYSEQYIKELGIIAPGLFGLGIAFPESYRNSFGIVEERVGLWKFMDFLNRILPVWLQYGL